MSVRRACGVASCIRPFARSPPAMCGWSAHRSWTSMTTASSISEIPQRRTSDRVARIAAVGDVHCGEEDRGAFRDHFARANEDADILVLCGDLTRRGLPAEFEVVVGELADVKTPIAAVLGNHDHESGLATEGESILRDRGIHVLAGDPFHLSEHVGLVGTKEIGRA